MLVEDFNKNPFKVVMNMDIPKSPLVTEWVDKINNQFFWAMDLGTGELYKDAKVGLSLFLPGSLHYCGLNLSHFTAK